MTHIRLNRGSWPRAGSMALALALVLTTSACAGLSANPFDRAVSGPTEIQISVENQNFNDLRLFAVTIRGPLLLGQVGGNASRTFRLDWDKLDELKLRIDFLADETYTTNPVNASPGDRLELVIPREPRNAYLRRRR